MFPFIQGFNANLFSLTFFIIGISCIYKIKYLFEKHFGSIFEYVNKISKSPQGREKKM